jgi:chorismate-pyruvate lyase
MSQALSRDDARVKIELLLDQFYSSPPGYGQLGDFASVDKVPPPNDALLDHNKHMTVTVESHHGEPVQVVVHRTNRQDNWYSREITLVTEHSRRIVQYGIVRLDVNALEPEVWKQIESQEIPLGRVLIQHNVLREVELCELWRIKTGPCLAALMHRSIGETVYGRTALIHCNGEPAIELLEIVAPIADSSGH